MSITDNSLIVQVSVEEMDRDLLAYLRLVENGETLVIVKMGKPVAELRPIFSSPLKLRPFSLCAGEFTVPGDFDDPLPEEIIQEFEGSAIPSP
jgi:antitoxin (DNA-binding transcriptional repressor) of toxin-antitoxin stability system